MLPIGVPPFVLKIMLGQMATLALMSQKVSADKIVATGFSFKYTTISDALKAQFISIKKPRPFQDGACFELC
jgi:NAD dependent epimerase/dehydratase family enzyme